MEWNAFVNLVIEYGGQCYKAGWMPPESAQKATEKTHELFKQIISEWCYREAEVSLAALAATQDSLVRRVARLEADKQPVDFPSFRQTIDDHPLGCSCDWTDCPGKMYAEQARRNNFLTVDGAWEKKKDELKQLEEKRKDIAAHGLCPDCWEKGKTRGLYHPFGSDNDAQKCSDNCGYQTAF